MHCHSYHHYLISCICEWLINYLVITCHSFLLQCTFSFLHCHRLFPIIDCFQSSFSTSIYVAHYIIISVLVVISGLVTTCFSFHLRCTFVSLSCHRCLIHFLLLCMRKQASWVKCHSFSFRCHTYIYVIHYLFPCVVHRYIPDGFAISLPSFTLVLCFVRDPIDSCTVIFRLRARFLLLYISTARYGK